MSAVSEPLHLSGTVCSNCGGAATYVLMNGANGRVIRQGDVLNLSQYAAGGSEGGAILFFTDNTQTSGTVAQDQDGQQINCDGVKDRWHDRHISLDAYAGKTVAFSMLLNDICSAGGRFDMYFNNVAIAGNGTVSTLYAPQFGATYSPANSSGWPGKATNIQAVAEPNSFAPGPDTHFYLADHLGSTQMELSGGGWPVWQGEFTPFGQEIVQGQTILPGGADGTAMRYKFTGKERDQESGLDYFGARYYASSLGRFTSPDWSEKATAVPYADLMNPQSLNLYDYVNNNPLVKTDADGHCPICVAVVAVAVGVAVYKGYKAWQKFEASARTAQNSNTRLSADIVDPAKNPDKVIQQNTQANATAMQDGANAAVATEGAAAAVVTAGDAAVNGAAEALTNPSSAADTIKDSTTESLQQVNDVQQKQVLPEAPTPQPTQNRPTPPAPPPPPKHTDTPKQY